MSPGKPQTLPRFGESWSFLYAEHALVEREDNAIVFVDARGRTHVPCASLSVLLLGPGTNVTHAAVTVLAENGCSIVWCGESAVRFYAAGLGETRRSANLLAQATAWADAERRLETVVNLYRYRFPEPLDDGLSLEQIRGKEGVRVRETYARMSKETGVEWRGRAYDTDEWTSGDPVNRALSSGNACLYGLVHAALISTGFSPALGFIHTGKALSFVYDIADLYKCETTIPVAFRLAGENPLEIEARTRRALRDEFRRAKIVERILPDVQRALRLRPEAVRYFDLANSPRDSRLWDPEQGEVAGGHNFADVPTGHEP